MSKYTFIIIMLLLYPLWRFTSPAFHSEEKRGMPTALGEGIVCPVMPPQVRSNNAPLQTSVPSRLKTLRFDKVTMTPMAGYSIRARVLSRKDYSHNTSPVDLLVGWNFMTQDSIVKQISFSQRGRFGYWQGSSSAINWDEVSRNAANMHLIPANYEIAQTMKRIGKDDTIQLNGWLVNLAYDDGSSWTTSLSRDDTGAGACELMLVCEVRILSR